MASGERFYLLELTHRPAVYGDLGSILKIQGIVIGGEGAQAILMLPGEVLWGETKWPEGSNVYTLTTEEWVDFLKRTDDPEVLVMPGKAFHRKLRFQISGHVQQKIWCADQFQCMYCNAKMPIVQLTIDHFIPLETGGANDTSNYLSACRRCNKNKGAMDPKDWCLKIGRDYDWFLRYLATRKIV